MLEIMVKQLLREEDFSISQMGRVSNKLQLCHGKKRSLRMKEKDNKERR